MVGKHSFCLRTNENSSNEKGPKTIQGFGDGEQNVSYKENLGTVNRLKFIPDLSIMRKYLKFFFSKI